MNSAGKAKKRKHPRIVVRWPVTMLTPEGEMKGNIENISAGGAYIRCKTLLSKKDHVTLSIMATNRKPLEIAAEVAWIDIPLIPDSEPVPIGMGIRFTNISEKDHQYISDIVAAHTES